MSKKNELHPISEVCPNCIDPLVPEKKKLGNQTNWFICPTCGYRERPRSENILIRKIGAFMDRRRKKNDSNGFKQID